MRQAISLFVKPGFEVGVLRPAMRPYRLRFSAGGTMCTLSTQMETVKVGMREFRENLAGYLESGTPLAILRHGETLGFYIPAQKRNRKAELEALQAAAKDPDEIIESWGGGE